MYEYDFEYDTQDNYPRNCAMLVLVVLVIVGGFCAGSGWLLLELAKILVGA